MMTAQENEVDNSDQFAGELDEIDSERGVKPLLFREGDDVFLEQGAEADTHLCIKCSHPSKKIVNKALRNPKNPGTWFGGCRRIGIGLCKKHAENFAVAKALTFSVLGLGIVFTVIGAATFGIALVSVGVLCCAASGVFRACVPVSSPNGNDEYAIIKGVGDAFKETLPEFQSPSPEEFPAE